MSEGYYASRKGRLLWGFDRFAGRARGPLVRRYGEAFATQALGDARHEFERLIPELPYIGGRRNLFSWVIVVNGWLVALHRALQLQGRRAEDSVAVAVEVADGFFRRIPRPLLRAIGWIAFTRPVRRVLRRQAERSQQRRYAEDFVYTFREGGGDDWALEFSECAVNKFYDAHQLPELKPYCNFFDVTYSRLMGMGVDASETIGLGCDTCRLRYRHRRETVVPARLEGMLPPV